VAYADGSSSTPNFPAPWQNSPNIVFIGGGSPLNAGAIRLDNLTGAPLVIDNVSVDLTRPGPVFNLWGSFTIPAQGSAILTQTQPGNFDTSAFPIVATCGGTPAPGDTRIPQIAVTIGGVAQTFADAAHVLDTGGFDFGNCRGNESMQWRPIGTTGIANAAGRLTLSPASTSASGGNPVTLTAQWTDAANQALSNATVNFQVLSGPNAGLTSQNITDAQGNAALTYTSSAQGGDVVQASVANASGASVSSNQVTVAWQSAACGPGTPPAGPGTSLIYLGASTAEFSDTVPLAALLTDSNGTPLTGRSLTFTLGSQSFSAVTDATGVARATGTGGNPGTVTLTVAFAGDGVQPAAQISQSIVIGLEETQILYTGKTLLGTAAPQTVSARLIDPIDQTPIANRTLTFQVGSVSATAITDANGNATTSITLTANETSGPNFLKIAFAGDTQYKPALRSIPVTIFLSTSFVIWAVTRAD